MDITLRDGTVIPTTRVELDDGTVGYELTLPDNSAVVVLRSVSPFVTADVVAANPELAKPQIPYIEVKSVAGGSQMLPARPGQEEYAAWEQEVDQVERARAELQESFTWDYGVVRWKRPPDADEYADMPPKAWKYPELLREYGREPRSGKRGRRVDFIRTVLLSSSRSLEAAQMMVYGLRGSPLLTTGEVDAAAELFPGD
jgi:hypothetical protein